MSEPAKVTGVQAINKALDDALALDPTVLVFGEDVADPEGGGIAKATKGLSTKYGARVRSTPIAEQAIVGAAIGASLAGFRPVAEIMLMNFTTVAMDMLVNHAAKLRFMTGGQTNVPITVRTMTGAGNSTGGQHADYFEAWFAHAAGMKVVAPSSPAEYYGLLLSCIFDDDPCLFIENLPTLRTVLGPAPELGKRIPLGKANVVRQGADVTLISYSRMVGESLLAAEKLAAEGISAEVIDLRTIVPLDRKTILGSVARTCRAVVVHEAVRNCGVGAEISAQITEDLFDRLKSPVLRVTAPDCAVPFSKPLETAYLVNADAIAQAARKTMRGQGR